MAMNEQLRPMDAATFARLALADVARNRWLLDALLRREYARIRALLGR